MDANRFDHLTRIVSRVASRRGLVRSGVAGLTGLTGLIALRIVGAGGAAPRQLKKKNHGKANRPRPNEFGCLNVEQHCRGKDSKCCSGICQGKRPKRGERDKSRCVGHNEGICGSLVNFCTASDFSQTACSTGSPPTAACFLTTGNSLFCGQAVGLDPNVNCRLCNRDSDCIAAGFPAGSACVIFSPASPQCAPACAATQNRACLLPGA